MNIEDQLKNKKAFTLVELMTVIAIIGILLFLARPAYIKLVARVRQSNAKNELKFIYDAQKTFYAEYNQYHPDLHFAGFVPDGYPTASNGDGSNCPVAELNETNMGSRPPRYYKVGTDTSIDDKAIPGRGKPSCKINAYQGYLKGSQLVADFEEASFSVAEDTFIIEATGQISDSQTMDRWTINQDLELNNTQSGI